MMRAADTFPAAVLTIAVVCSSVLAGSRRESDLSGRCARALAAIAVRTEVTVSPSGAQLSIGGKEVRLSAQIENQERSKKKFFVGLVVHVSIDGVFQPLSAGSIGVGDTQKEAEETAIQEWAQLVGVALVNALSSKGPGLPFEGFLAFPGFTGIRGSPDIFWSEQNPKELLAHMKPLAPNLLSSPGELHSVSIIATVKQDGVVDGECRVDSKMSPATLRLIQSFPWPATKTGYMIKQFYILLRQSA